MTTDNGVHLLGTKFVHQVPPLGIMAVGILLDHSPTMAFGAGMLVVLLFGNMRAQAPHYRWRVDNGDTNDC